MADYILSESLATALGSRDAGVPLTAHRQDSPLALLRILLRQACHEVRLHRLRHIRFRSRQNDEACRAYEAMEPWEFEGVNARQAWANWRTIHRNLDRRVPGGPLRAVDLCCGTGQSTEVLAYYLPPGSRILGLEYCPHFVAAACGRTYLSRDGRPAAVAFRVQSVLDTFRDPDGAPLGEASIDLVNSSGAVGCHFDCSATARLAAEVDRVLRPGGLALIDSGHSGTPEQALLEIFRARGFSAVHRARSCAFDRYEQVCFRKAEAP